MDANSRPGQRHVRPGALATFTRKTVGKCSTALGADLGADFSRSFDELAQACMISVCSRARTLLGPCSPRGTFKTPAGCAWLFSSAILPTSTDVDVTRRRRPEGGANTSALESRWMYYRKVSWRDESPAVPFPPSRCRPRAATSPRCREASPAALSPDAHR